MFPSYQRSRSWAVQLVALLLVASFLVGLIASLPGQVEAQRAGPVPRGTQWCGLAYGGGSVRMEISTDGRFVNRIEIRTTKGSLGSGEVGSQNRAQIADGKFIFRSDREEKECRRVRETPGGRSTRVPCRPRCRTPGCRGTEVCTTDRVNEMTIRGTFTSPESVRGTFTALKPYFYSGRARRTDRARISGTYVAWPVDVAPCP